ncbi:MAG: hypothetical protein IKM44_01785, partial [Clostridia bacterium]|nr:hypothetical protein [Clostridia bacterium]
RVEFAIYAFFGCENEANQKGIKAQTRQFVAEVLRSTFIKTLKRSNYDNKTGGKKGRSDYI